eukprot:scaffold4675_cov101-Cylindrotheca_fusiformis.AAC.5
MARHRIVLGHGRKLSPSSKRDIQTDDLVLWVQRRERHTGRRSWAVERHTDRRSSFMVVQDRERHTGRRSWAQERIREKQHIRSCAANSRLQKIS